MGRKSKLSEKQWEAVKTRLLSGEKAADLAREFGVSKTVISQRFSERIQTVRELANKIVAVDYAFKKLPVVDQLETLSMVDELKAISTHLAGAARFGSATAHRLAGIANAKVQEIDDAAPMDDASMDTLKGIAVLTRMANDASVIGVNLINANKDTVKKINEPPESQAENGLESFYGRGR